MMNSAPVSSCMKEGDLVHKLLYKPINQYHVIDHNLIAWPFKRQWGKKTGIKASHWHSCPGLGSMLLLDPVLNVETTERIVGESHDTSADEMRLCGAVSVTVQSYTVGIYCPWYGDKQEVLSDSITYMEARATKKTNVHCWVHEQHKELLWLLWWHLH